MAGAVSDAVAGASSGAAAPSVRLRIILIYRFAMSGVSRRLLGALGDGGSAAEPTAAAVAERQHSGFDCLAVSEADDGAPTGIAIFQLHPALAALVHTGVIASGSLVEATDWRAISDPTSAIPQRHIVVQGLRVLGMGEAYDSPMRVLPALRQPAIPGWETPALIAVLAASERALRKVLAAPEVYDVEVAEATTTVVMGETASAAITGAALVAWRPRHYGRHHYLPSLTSDSAMALIPSWWSMSRSTLTPARVEIAWPPVGAELDAAKADDAVASGMPASPAILYASPVPGMASIAGLLAAAAVDASESSAVGAKRARYVERGPITMAAVAGGAEDAGLSAKRARTAAASSSAPSTSLEAAADGDGAGERDLAYRRPLIGRLVSVGRLVHYGASPKAGSQPVPFTFQCTIADSTRSLNVSTWGLAAIWYHRALSLLPVGSMVAITGYRLKVHEGRAEASVNPEAPRPAKSRLTTAAARATADAALLAGVQNEGSGGSSSGSGDAGDGMGEFGGPSKWSDADYCNRMTRRGRFFVIPDGLVAASPFFAKAGSQYPPLSLALTPFAELSTLAAGTMCNVAGMIVRVGPIIVRPLPNKPGDGGDSGDGTAGSLSAGAPAPREPAFVPVLRTTASESLGLGVARGQLQRKRTVWLRDQPPMAEGDALTSCVPVILDEAANPVTFSGVACGVIVAVSNVAIRCDAAAAAAAGGAEGATAVPFYLACTDTSFITAVAIDPATRPQMERLLADEPRLAALHDWLAALRAAASEDGSSAAAAALIPSARQQSLPQLWKPALSSLFRPSTLDAYLRTMCGDDSRPPVLSLPELQQLLSYAESALAAACAAPAAPAPAPAPAPRASKAAAAAAPAAAPLSATSAPPAGLLLPAAISSALVAAATRRDELAPSALLAVGQQLRVIVYGVVAGVSKLALPDADAEAWAGDDGATPPPPAPKAGGKGVRKGKQRGSKSSRTAAPAAPPELPAPTAFLCSKPAHISAMPIASLSNDMGDGLEDVADDDGDRMSLWAGRPPTSAMRLAKSRVAAAAGQLPDGDATPALVLRIGGGSVAGGGSSSAAHAGPELPVLLCPSQLLLPPPWDADAAHPSNSRLATGFSFADSSVVVDDDTTMLRGFFPPHLPVGEAEFWATITDAAARFAFCLTVQFRRVSQMTATSSSSSASASSGGAAGAGVAAAPPQLPALRLRPTVRVEAIYQLDSEGRGW